MNYVFNFRGHYITLLSGFESDLYIEGLQEVAPTKLVDYIRNYTDWDLVGARYAGKSPLTLWKALEYPAEVKIQCKYSNQITAKNSIRFQQQTNTKIKKCYIIIIIISMALFAFFYLFIVSHRHVAIC